MSENIATFYLMVVIAMSDHELHEKEAMEIKDIAMKFKVNFDPYEAADEIRYYYKKDFKKACDFYMSIVQNPEIQKETINFLKRVIYSDKKIRDREVEILEKCRKEWGIK